jgi:hypothetical protein
MVRLRVTHALSGSIDGIRLSDVRVGFVYDVGATLGCYLRCMDIWPESTFPRIRAVRGRPTVDGLPTPQVAG